MHLLIKSDMVLLLLAIRYTWLVLCKDSSWMLASTNFCSYCADFCCDSLIRIRQAQF